MQRCQPDEKCRGIKRLQMTANGRALLVCCILCRCHFPDIMIMMPLLDDKCTELLCYLIYYPGWTEDGHCTNIILVSLMPSFCRDPGLIQLHAVYDIELLRSALVEQQYCNNEGVPQCSYPRQHHAQGGGQASRLHGYFGLQNCVKYLPSSTCQARLNKDQTSHEG